MILAETVHTLRAQVATWRREGHEIAFVPTMGYLHEGHGALMNAAAARGGKVVVSIFVNPLQFDRAGDLAAYPRDRERDLELARAAGVDLVFLPGESDLYPDGAPVVTVDPGRLAETMEGAHRPGHFRGVLTVVAKLFNLVEPDVAFFGRKDLQQAVLVRRMVRDLDFPVDVHVVPTVREPDGLALSSRNVRLSPDQRAAAPALFRALDAGRRAVIGGNRDASAVRQVMAAVLEGHPAIDVEYLEVFDPHTLRPVDEVREGTTAAVAAHLGAVRLIDNLVLEGE